MEYCEFMSCELFPCTMEGCDRNLSGKEEVQKFRFQTPASRSSHDVTVANKEEKKERANAACDAILV